MDRSIQYVRSSALGSTMLTSMHGTECKGLGKILGVVVGVVAAIAIPFLAPVVGAALGGGFFASIAGQALIGAGLGAIGGGVSSAISGGDILKGALIGGAGGAIAGGVSAWASGAGLTAAAPASSSAAPGGFSIAAAGGGTNLSTGLITGVDPVTGLALSTTGAVAGGQGILATAPDAVAGAAPAAGTAASTGTVAATGTGLSTGFKTAAVQSLLSAGTQALQSMLPNQQAELFAQMQKEMEITRQQDLEAYAAQKKIFDEYYGYAKSLNPTFFAELERANAQQRLSATWSDTERSLRERGAGDFAITSERRRQEVEGTAGLSTAYTGGFLRGQQAQGAAYQTASSLYPKTPTNYLAGLRGLYDAAGARDADLAGGVAGIVEPWKVYLQGKVENRDNTRVG